MMPETSTSAFVVDTSHSPYARLRPVALTDVHLTDMFWEPRRTANRTKTLLSQFDQLEETGTLDNFRRVFGEKSGAFRGPVFMDSDLYKWLEAASSSLVDNDGGNDTLRQRVEEAVRVIAGAQQPDGYLNTYFTFEHASERFTNLKDLHEMYCAGHFIQAAIAHYRATGSETLLTVARGVADNLCETFGPEAEGKIVGTDGHPEIELALVELYRATGEKRYLAQAEFFLDARGRMPRACYNRNDKAPWHFNDNYRQDHVPYRDLDEVTGHAVRMLYLASGAADIYLETGDAEIKAAINKQWDNMTTRRMYVTGGLGARHEGEAFGKDYELPNARAYTETCAAIASVMWNYRLLLATGEARYADLLEWTLYNAVLPGLSLDGEHYFYENPLENDGTHRRRKWFGCACCPPNIARLLAQLPGYFYSVSPEGVWAHLYAEGTAELPLLPGGKTVRLTTATNYPWDGDITFTVEGGGGEFSLFLRIPAWCENGAAITVNGTLIPESVTPGSYAELRRAWQSGDTVRLHLPMPVRALEAHPHVTEDTNRIALSRGPLLYCVEETDHAGSDIRDLVYAGETEPKLVPDLLGGVVVLRGVAKAVQPWQPGSLYRTARPHFPVTAKPAVPLTFIPYYAWANRSEGRMLVWLQAQPDTKDAE